MKQTKRLLLCLSGASLCGALLSCVTINIYFPAAAAEKAADKIIDEVWRLDQGAGTSNAKPAAK
ncbi:MAG TPA: hypothetical protein VK864_00640 [Longimicrobiales bacterium]|nr:hypothetical protein [Longimicrobiales bacterium]